MFKRLMVLAALLLAVGVMAQAQDAPEGTVREIYTVLAYGDEVFEPEVWFASATEAATRTTAQWTSAGLGGLAFLDYLHFEQGMDEETMDATFGEDWFSVILSTYGVWRELTGCEFEPAEDEAGENGILRLWEFSMETGTDKYMMRYWAQPIGETRVLTIFIVFPTLDTENLDSYSERLFPDAWTCEPAA